MGEAEPGYIVFPTELNNFLNVMVTLPPISSYPMVTPAVTKPRQGPPCFGPWIMNEPAVPLFQLGRVTKPYNSSTKPQDWLIDYVSSVHITGGNRRWAVRYLPHILEGPAQIWLNNLPEGSINSYMDLEEVFYSNFSSTYKRPNRPQFLTMCDTSQTYP